MHKILWQEIFYSLDLSNYPSDRIAAYEKKLKEKFQCPVWRTKDGRSIPMDYMKPSHLINSFRACTKAVWDLYKESCADNLRYDDIYQLYLKALKQKNNVKLITSAQARQGYKPTEEDISVLRGMISTLENWYDWDDLGDRDRDWDDEF